MLSSHTDTRSLSIGRHAAQFILRTAMLAEPQACYGLIALSQDDSTKHHIIHAEAIPQQGSATLNREVLNEGDLRHILKTWQDQNIICCGTFFSSPSAAEPDSEKIKHLQQQLSTLLPTHKPMPLFHLFASLNTKGCLETFAYQLKDDVCLPIPLLLHEDSLHEDGQQPSSD